MLLIILSISGSECQQEPKTNPDPPIPDRIKILNFTDVMEPGVQYPVRVDYNVQNSFKFKIFIGKYLSNGHCESFEYISGVYSAGSNSNHVIRHISIADFTGCSGNGRYYINVNALALNGDPLNVAGGNAEFLIGNPNFPACLSQTNKTHYIQFDYMTGYNFLDEGQYFRLVNSYSKAKIIIDRLNTDNEKVIETFNANNSITTRNDLLLNYAQANFNSGLDADGYLVSINDILNDPEPQSMGITLYTSWYPAFVYTGRIRNQLSEPQVWTIVSAIHELGHQILKSDGHDGHGQENENCCVIREIVSTFGCNNYAYTEFCGNHMCALNNSISD